MDNQKIIKEFKKTFTEYAKNERLSEPAFIVWVENFILTTIEEVEKEAYRKGERDAILNNPKEMQEIIEAVKKQMREELCEEIEKLQKSMLRDGDDLKVHYYNTGVTDALNIINK